MAKKKHLNISNFQLMELETAKITGELIQSKIRLGELFIKTTLYRDIKYVFFHKEKQGEVSDEKIEPILDKLFQGGFIELCTEKSTEQTLIWICKKTWNSQSLKLSTKTEP